VFAAGGAALPTLRDLPAFDVEEVGHPGGDILLRGLVRRGEPV
jgi:hypothetical protein